MLECADCRGTGQRRVFTGKAPTNLPDLATCPTCNGAGQLANEPPSPVRARRGVPVFSPFPQREGSPGGRSDASDPATPQPPTQD